MKLELKHLAPYPPTLKLIWQDVQCSFEGVDYTSGKVILERVDVSLKNVKPILRPLSDLKKEINMHGDMVSAYEILPTREKEDYKNPIIGYWSWNAMQILFEWHFDVFGLIEKGLAIDINTLKK